MSYYDDWEPDYDSLDYHSRAGWGESLYENGQSFCDYHDEVYDMDLDSEGYRTVDNGCPACHATREAEERIANGDLSPDAICYGCGGAESTTEFMGKRVCWPCYQSLAQGKMKPDRCVFAEPGGRSALRAAGPGNPRVHPCPNCHEPNVLTPQDVARGYQCDTCADYAESFWQH